MGCWNRGGGRSWLGDFRAFFGGDDFFWRGLGSWLGRGRSWFWRGLGSGWDFFDEEDFRGGGLNKIDAGGFDFGQAGVDEPRVQKRGETQEGEKENGGAGPQGFEAGSWTRWNWLAPAFLARLMSFKNTP